MSALRRIVWRSALVACVVTLLTAGAFVASPWPGALMIRAAFDRGAERTARSLQAHVPAGGVEHLGEIYDASDPDGRFDLFLPEPASRAAGAPLAVVVWVHGGGAVSGRRGDVGNYARILAAQGFAVVAVDYTIAPEATYPTPVRQVNAALGYLAAHGSRWGLSTDRFVLAGDSAGAHIAAQVGNLTAVPAYARALGIAPALRREQLRALLLFCGPYVMRSSDLDGLARAFMHTVLWAYSGTRRYENDARFATANVIDHVTADFPPTLVSAGNADPLLRHSVALATKLRDVGAPVRTLFFASDHQPALSHEYQFDLDGDAGRLALLEAVAFAREHTRGEPPAPSVSGGKQTP